MRLGSFVLLGLIGSCSPSASVPTAGGDCNQENVGACETSTRLLSCRQQRWTVVSDCKGPDGCRRIGDTVDCDTRGNSIGDFCNNPGRVRCEPDAGTSILRCVETGNGGVLNVEFVCPPLTPRCALGDGGLTCL